MYGYAIVKSESSFFYGDDLELKIIKVAATKKELYLEMKKLFRKCAKEFLDNDRYIFNSTNIDDYDEDELKISNFMELFEKEYKDGFSIVYIDEFDSHYTINYDVVDIPKISGDKNERD